mmetsp:Transcript_24049/g.56852  ORF Transcript_24049/g.56852 Transcript_24049/m.56852 type:complete len:421 (-) Transcript_24049:56-1318(-)
MAAAAARRVLALGAAGSWLATCVRLGPEAAEDRSALYQQNMQVHLRPIADSLPAAAQRLQAITGKHFSEEELAGAPISEKPWQRLEQRGQAYALLDKTVSALEAPVARFLMLTSERKAVLRQGRYGGGLDAHALIDTVSPVLKEWRSIADAIQAGFNSAEIEKLVADPDVKESVRDIAKDVSEFGSNVEWLTTSSLRRVPHWGNLGKEMIPAQLEVMKTIISEFSEQKDELLQTARESFEEFAGHLSADLREPFTLLGPGTCVDSAGRRYSSFEAPGCETPFDCVQGCRSFRAGQCWGATLRVDALGCGRCELRMEANFSEGKGKWSQAWTAGMGQGEVVSTAAGALGGDIRCYKREKPEWWEWPKAVQGIFEQDILELEHNFTKLTKSWRALLFKIDRAFWQVESGFELAAPAIASGWS